MLRDASVLALKTPVCASATHEQPFQIARLKKRAEFVRAASRGNKIVTSSFVMQWIDSPELLGEKSLCVRVGFTVTKKVGNAVVRNRVKRRLRAAVQDIFHNQMKLNTDYVLIGRKNCVQCSYDTLCRDLKYALKKVKAA